MIQGQTHLEDFDLNFVRHIVAPCSWTSRGGVYEMEANGKRYQNQSWDRMFYLLRTEVLAKEFQGLSIN